MGTRFIVITPVRDEQRHFEETITSMTRQTIQPDRWVIVDDGSSDSTPELVDSAANQHDWIEAIHRANGGRRHPGGGVVRAFRNGYALVKDLPWDFLVKLDGDLSFAPDYFELCLAQFMQDPSLGIGGGTVHVLRGGRPQVDAPSDPTFHVRGATKIYRRACWHDIEPLIESPGWDTVDEVKANMKGWTTRTFRHIPILQHKNTGAADGVWRNWVKNGRACYVAGYDPLFMIGKCVRRTFASPPIAGIALAVGYLSGGGDSIEPRTEPEVIQYLRRQQRRRLTLRKSIYKEAGR